jgi:hypothetical protein
VEHQEALDTHAAEGYLLGDLTAAEYAAFEQHFADCDECFADVRDAATVVAAVRVDGEKKELTKRGQSKLMPWFAAAASVVAAMLGTVTTYQAHQLAQLRKPGLVAQVDLPRDQRGAAEKDVVVNGSRDAVLNFDITLEPASAPFTCRIVDAQGHTRNDPVSVSADEAAAPVNLKIPAKSLEPGEYSLIVSGTGGVSLPEKRFKVR